MIAPVTRFAPSPTGKLHLGHAYSAIQAHDRARAAGGRFLLRIEDIDGARSRPEHAAGIEADLRWLGLEWDGPVVFQSARLELYAAALERLRGMGLLYPCFCTRAEIAASLSAPHGVEGVYPGMCRGLGEAKRAARVAAGVPYAWRLDVGRAVAQVRHPGPVPGSTYPHAPQPVLHGGPRHKAGVTDLEWPDALLWHDEIAGDVLADPLALGDVVLARKDAPASYHLAVTVDDAAQGVTHVVRGVDLFSATHIHRLLQALLDLPTPLYRHHALLTGADGQRLAKRHGAPTLESVRLRGGEGLALADQLRSGVLPIGFARANA
ncbi:glutamyl-Q tRNA(Asp) synthetase [Sphingomonas sp. HMP6]|uniref:glutamyl-Q tRNA(Asp) synthetase n=1 Tax=Sphingomonas sp. HMP6 TaxID=1517551 RepID=UPI00159653C2|nr:glutamyl-Q tRNA(Asp) synthetase [Sphingomonas sp. HMP6]BCA59784.1 hypothetical protein HMP06_2553 [Sphingomonas sp. HMP6]